MNSVILVCGLGRCGSSLVMQMLKAGGISVDGTAPWYETRDIYDGHWIAQQAGRAIKILEPHKRGITFESGDYKSIWIDRDPREQAKSYIKFLRDRKHVPIADPGYQRKKLIASFKEERPKGVAVCEDLGPVLYLQFEKLIEEPVLCALDIALFVGIDSIRSLYEMSIQVQDRSPEKLPTMDLETDLETIGRMH
ncbi:MAG: sulfotransferase domain-containing protein [Proteobacteria bacterium]|nr:sulfotransferase domain-containing protein [Pseudomonadota bacterium]